MMALVAGLMYFDTHEYVKRSKELGVSEQVAEHQVYQIQKALEVAVKSLKEEMKSNTLTPKGDLETLK